MTLSEELTWRGLVKDTTLTDLTQLDRQKWTFYCGFDASADSQTIGNLASLMAVKTFLRHGHQALIVAGGATSLIGDPGGRNQERQLQTKATIEANIAIAKDQINQVLSGTGGQLTILNNLDWLNRLNLIDFLRDIGKNFSMSQLIKRDFISQRLGDQARGISYAEFSYSLLQGYDFYHLFKNYGCRLQLGGADQWTNCLSGVDLIQKLASAPVEVITLPLIINQATGRKFGKSEAGAVWLSSTRTSVYDFYQFWLNSDDAGLQQYLQIFTELDQKTVAQIVAQHQARVQDRSGQKRLAEEVTRLVHGPDNYQTALTLTGLVFNRPDFEPEQLIKDDLIKSIQANRICPSLSQVDQWPLALEELGLVDSQSQLRQLGRAEAVKVQAANKSLSLSLEDHSAFSWQQLVADNQLQAYQDQSCDFWLIRRGKNKLGLIYRPRI